MEHDNGVGVIVGGSGYRCEGEMEQAIGRQAFGVVVQYPVLAPNVVIFTALWITHPTTLPYGLPLPHCLMDYPPYHHCLMDDPYHHCLMDYPYHHCLMDDPYHHCLMDYPYHHCLMGYPSYHKTPILFILVLHPLPTHQTFGNNTPHPHTHEHRANYFD